MKVDLCVIPRARDIIGRPGSDIARKRRNTGSNLSSESGLVNYCG